MKHILIATLLIISNLSFGQSIIESNVIDNSRKSCVKIYSQQGQSIGTGFFISEDLIATCFHVVGTFEVIGVNVNCSVFNDLIAITESGENVSVSCISIPSGNSLEPLLQDFAILKTTKIIKDKTILNIASNNNHNIGEPIAFSGYPLGTPVMVTHLGTISGITKDKTLICVQASTNKGNSGGALINKKGEVIGIVSMREGGISPQLQTYLKNIEETEKRGSVQLMGIDPLQATKETVKILDQYISTGIGYARDISFLKNYILKYKIKL